MAKRSKAKPKAKKAKKAAKAAARASPAAIAVEDLARLLSAVGGRQISAEAIEADLEAGAPRNADGTMNLVHYAAWLVQAAG